MTLPRCCWTCQLQRKGGHLTFLGFCEWFPMNGRERKEITRAVVDVGCKFHVPRLDLVVEGPQTPGEFLTEGM